MAQADGIVSNASGAAVRADLNNQLAAVFTNHSGATEPSTTYAYQWWADTSAGVMKLRNATNTAWATLFQLDGTYTIEDGTAAAPGLTFTNDINTGIYSPGADQFAIATGGVERLRFNVSRAILTGAYQQTAVAVTALDIDCSAGNYFTKTINSNSTFTVSNVPSGVSYSFTLELTHTSGTVTWFSGVQWPSSIVPTLTTGKTHLFMFVTDDGGTRWRAASLVNYTT